MIGLLITTVTYFKFLIYLYAPNDRAPSFVMVTEFKFLSGSPEWRAHQAKQLSERLEKCLEGPHVCRPQVKAFC